MLYLIGMGLEEGDMTLKGVEALKKCKEVFTDVYTSIPYRIFGKKAEREIVESDFLVKLAEKKDVALLVPGDPLFATTHISLVSEARKRGIEVQVIHAPSVMNAVARTGLSPYRFGRTVTVGSEIFPSDMEKIEKNMKCELHTLCLFDPSVDPRECLKALFQVVREKIVLCSKLGTREEKVYYGKIEKILKNPLKKPVCAVIPGKLLFYEREFLEVFSI